MYKGFLYWVTSDTDICVYVCLYVWLSFTFNIYNIGFIYFVWYSLFSWLLLIVYWKCIYMYVCIYLCCKYMQCCVIFSLKLDTFIYLFIYFIILFHPLRLEIINLVFVGVSFFLLFYKAFSCVCLFILSVCL